MKLLHYYNIKLNYVQVEGSLCYLTPLRVGLRREARCVRINGRGCKGAGEPRVPAGVEECDRIEERSVREGGAGGRDGHKMGNQECQGVLEV